MPQPESPYIPLPGNDRVAAREGFNRVAALYDAARPGYPAAVFADLRDRCGLGPRTDVLEIGCGSGQATRDLAEVGCRIRCVELGADLAALARVNLAGHPNVTVEVGAFEEVELPAAGFDVVFSATAFHWIDPTVGFPRAAHVLRSGGFFALVSSTHVEGGTQELIAGDVQQVHRRHAPEIGPWRFIPAKEVVELVTAGGDIAHVWARIDRNFVKPPDVGELFEDPVVSAHPYTVSYDRDGYVAMLSTQSTYVLLDPERRDRIMTDLAALIDDRLGGTITKQYVAVVAIARRR